MMRKPMPALCFVAMLFRVLKMSKRKKPEGFTPLGRKLASVRPAAQSSRTRPAKSRTMCVW